MQTFKITLKDESLQSYREVQVESESVELAHKDGYFHHASQREEIVSIANEEGDIMFTEDGGFSTMPQQPPSENCPGGVPDEMIEEILDDGTFNRCSENINFL